MIKATYSLDVPTVRALEGLATRWGVSKSEALRRVIRMAAETRGSTRQDSLVALAELQRSLALTPRKAAAWLRQAREERRASAAKRESRVG